MRTVTQILLLVVVVAAVAGSASAQITVDHEPWRTYVSDTTNGYEIKAKITSTAGSINIRRVFYAVNGTSYGLLFMQPTGRPDEFIATIPGRPQGSTIRYYIFAGDTGGNTTTDPANAPGQGDTSHIFYIGHYEVVFSDDMEGNDPGWVSSAAIGEDDWEWGEPNLGGGGQNDPLTAWSGVQVRGNDLNGSGNQAGKYPANVSNQLDSPTVDTTNRPRILLQMRRWLTVEEGIYDTSIIYANGNEVYRNQDNGHTLDTEWKPYTLDISTHSGNNPAAQVRFEINSDGGLEFGGWTIDDFQLVERIFSNVSLTVNDNTPSIGSDLNVTVIADPMTNYYFLAARFMGQGTFDVPNGPTVFSGLDGPSTKQYWTGMTDASGRADFTRRVPNRANFIGVVRWSSAVGFASGWVESNLQRLEVVP